MATRKVNTDQLKDNALSTLKQGGLVRSNKRTATRKRWIAAIPDEAAAPLDTDLLDKRLRGRKGLPKEWAVYHLDRWLQENITRFAISRRVITTALIDSLMAQDYELVIPEFGYRGNNMDVMAIHAGRVIEYRILLSGQELSNEIARGVQFGPHMILNYHANLRLGKLLPNAFYFVIPEGYIAPNLLPEHVGVIEARKGAKKGSFQFVAVRTPQQLHADFIPAKTYKMIAETLYKRLMQ